jgi:hypothetical protein
VPIDRRLRNELQRDAERIDPEVERNLGAVEARGRRSSNLGAPMLLAATVVIALVVGLRLVQPEAPSVGASPTPGPAASGPSASAAASFDAIAGTYLVTLDGTDPVVAANKLAGTWTMRLAADGEIFLSSPETFGSGTGNLSGLAFSLQGDRFRSNIFYNDFCGSIGTYTWARSGGKLSFAPVDDTCQARRTLLATAPWRTGP